MIFNSALIDGGGQGHPQELGGTGLLQQVVLPRRYGERRSMLSREPVVEKTKSQGDESSEHVSRNHPKYKNGHAIVHFRSAVSCDQHFQKASQQE